jgi:hypothetical protein
MPLSLPNDDAAWTWVPMKSGMWAARRNGVFVGVIEQVEEEGFTVADSDGHIIGQYATLITAQTAAARIGGP